MDKSFLRRWNRHLPKPPFGRLWRGLIIIFFKKTKEKFKQEHPEVARYEKAAAYLAKHPDDKDSTQKELQQEQEKLLSDIAELKVPLTEVQEDLKKLRDIRYWVRKATPGTEESIAEILNGVKYPASVHRKGGFRYHCKL